MIEIFIQALIFVGLLVAFCVISALIVAAALYILGFILEKLSNRMKKVGK